MGCIARLGCLVLLALLAVGALAHARPLAATRSPARRAATSAAPRVGAAHARRGGARQAKLDELVEPPGPGVHQPVGERGGVVRLPDGRRARIPASADSAEAAVIGDALYVRAVVPVRDIARHGRARSARRAAERSRARCSSAARFHVIRPGLSEFEVREIKLRDFKVPTGAIPRLVQQISKGEPSGGRRRRTASRHDAALAWPTSASRTAR